MNTSMNGRILSVNVHRRTQVITVDLSQVLWPLMLLEGGMMCKEVTSAKHRIKKVQSHSIEAVYVAKRKGTE